MGRVAGVAVALLVCGFAAIAFVQPRGEGGEDAGDRTATDASPTPAPVPSPTVAAREFPPPPSTPEGALSAEVDAALAELAGGVGVGGLSGDALAVVADSADARLGWFLSDLLRFFQGGGQETALIDAFTAVTGTDASQTGVARTAWGAVTDLMIAWDLPAPPGYREHKAAVYLQVEPAWEPFFDDADAAIDWRWVSWGGVLIDDRPLGDTGPCPDGCIPALDDPALTDADGGDWYGDERVVFGVVVGDEAVAFPRHIMEIHEMVNLTIGGERLGIPYCTLCGSAQAYRTAAVPDGITTPVLRTSGLLSRSNKVAYDLETRSVFDTFTGEALSGPLRAAGVTLEQVTVVTTTWGEWRAAHPGTQIVAEDGGIGRRYPDDPLGGRDDDGPIFPIGPADPRLPAQVQVLGVIGPEGPVAFPAEQAHAALTAGEPVTAGGVEVVADGGGLRARGTDGTALPAHQAFWFAWSQFHPDTAIWTPLRT